MDLSSTRWSDPAEIPANRVKWQQSEPECVCVAECDEGAAPVCRRLEAINRVTQR